MFSCELLSDFVYSFFEHNVKRKRDDESAVVNCFQILYIRSLNTIEISPSHQLISCELLSDFVYSFFEHNCSPPLSRYCPVVNCFQILYIRSLNTIRQAALLSGEALWIAFRFCIFVLWTQSFASMGATTISCELLSDFVYSFFEHNPYAIHPLPWLLWIAFRFCIFVLWTQSRRFGRLRSSGCELLSDFVYSFFEHNALCDAVERTSVVNCFQILYIRSLNTIQPSVPRALGALWIAFRFCIFVLWTQWGPRCSSRTRCCELLSDFVYSFFEHNAPATPRPSSPVVNCFQILYIRSLNTIGRGLDPSVLLLWIAFRFCIFVLWTQWAART